MEPILDQSLRNAADERQWPDTQLGAHAKAPLLVPHQAPHGAVLFRLAERQIERPRGHIGLGMADAAAISC